MPEPPGEIDRVEMTLERGALGVRARARRLARSPDGRPVPPSLASHLDDSIKFMHVSAPIRVMERAEWSPIGLREFGLDPPGYTATLYRRRPPRARGGVRRAEPAAGAAVHEARGTRPGLPDVAIHRRGMGAGDPRGDRRVSAALAPGRARPPARSPRARRGVGPRRRQHRLRSDHGEPEHRPLHADPAHGRAAVGSGRDPPARPGGEPAEPGQAPRRRCAGGSSSAPTEPAASRVRARSRPRPPTPAASRCTRLRVRERGAGSRRARTTSSTSSAPITTRWPRWRPAARRGSWPSPPSRARRGSRWELATPAPRRGSFFKLGIEHILTGYDHLLFLAALLLRGGGFLSLFKIITAFTIAHSITLALAVLGVVDHSRRARRAAIAASIVWVALENILL